MCGFREKLKKGGEASVFPPFFTLKEHEFKNAVFRLGVWQCQTLTAEELSRLTDTRSKVNFQRPV